MTQLFRAAALATVLCTGAAAAHAADKVTETRAIDARTASVNLGGVIELHIKQGATASLVISGDRDMVDKVTTSQSGDTLSIDMKKAVYHLWGKTSGVHAELTLPNLRAVSADGVGSTTVDGFNGDAIKLTLQGTGSVDLNSHYNKVEANLDGVGSMKLNPGNMDQLTISSRGAGSVTVTGNVKTLRASLGGVGGLDAKKLFADAVDLSLGGIGSATVNAKTSAAVSLSGLGSATVYGKPATRSESKAGMGSIHWE